MHMVKMATSSSSVSSCSIKRKHTVLSLEKYLGTLHRVINESSVALSKENRHLDK